MPWGVREFAVTELGNHVRDFVSVPAKKNAPTRLDDLDARFVGLLLAPCHPVYNHPRLDTSTSKLMGGCGFGLAAGHGCHPMMSLERARSAVSCSMPAARDVCPPRVIPRPLGWREAITVYLPISPG